MDDMGAIEMVFGIILGASVLIWFVSMLLIYGFCRFHGISFKRICREAFVEMVEKRRIR